MNIDQELHQFLSQCDSGASLTELLAALRDGPGVCQALEKAVADGTVAFSFGVGDANVLIFHCAKATPAWVAPTSGTYKTVDQVLRHMHGLLDGRGDPSWTETPQRLSAAFCSAVNSEELADALALAIHEKVLGLRCVAPSKYVFLTLKQHQRFTVVAQDTAAHQALCFHVRAGDADIALKKVQASSYGGEYLKVYGIVEGIVHFEPAPGHCGFVVEKL